ncbi:MAG: cell division protein FtsA [Thermodesulfovibrionales bacterium]
MDVLFLSAEEQNRGSNFGHFQTKSMRSDVVIGLDVGTTKICVVAGSKTTKGLKVLTIGSSESRGLKKGIVVDAEDTTKSIVMALKEAEDRGRLKIDSACVGIAGGHIKSFNGYSVLEIREREITENDIERLIDMAAVAYVPIDREVLQIIPSFSIDGVNGIIDPLGKKGKRLEAKVHIITGAITPVQNLIRCCEEAGVRVADIVLEPVASAEAVLSKEEKDMGTLMIDLGGGTTDIALFRDGALRHTASLAIGGNHITNDIATGLDLTVDEAEKVKKAYGLVGTCDEIDIRGKVKQMSNLLYEIVYLRCEELFSLIKKEIVTFSGYKNREKLPPYIKRVVLTGGTSLLKGIDRVAEKTLGRQVRIGIPYDVTDRDLKNPIYSTGLGLVKLGLKSGDTDMRKVSVKGNWNKEASSFLIKPANVIEKMKDWVTGFLNK